MKKYVCTVCGYIAEGEIPAQCPVCKAPASSFVEKKGNTYVTEHVVGIGKAEGVPQEIVDGLRANFEGECSEVGMYLAMARVAEREGYPEIAEAYKRYAYEEADHASRFAELLGEVVTDSTKKNLMMRAEAECGACAGKMDLAKKAKALNLDAIHDTVHEMAKDEARHGRGFEGLLKRYFNTEVLSGFPGYLFCPLHGIRCAAGFLRLDMSLPGGLYWVKCTKRGDGNGQTF